MDQEAERPTAPERPRGSGSAIMVQIGDEVLSLTAWARRAGLPTRTVHQRYRMGWTGEALLAPACSLGPALTKARELVVIGARAATLATWSRETGIDYKTLYARYRQGVRGEDLLKPPGKRVKNE